MKRRAIVFTGKERLETREEELPVLGPGQILVQTVDTLISSGTERIVFTRDFAPGTHWDNWVKYPFYPGYLMVGRVAAVGPGVTGVKEGSRIAARAGHASHHIFDVGNARGGNGSGVDAASASVKTAQLHVIPAEVADEEAVWMGLGKITQVGVRAAEHKLGDAVAVIGLGPLGQLVVQYARLFGAREVIAIDTVPLRVRMAQEHGATRCLCMAAGEALAAVREATDGRGADVVYESTGHPAVFSAALPLARRFGTVVLLGDTGNPGRQALTGDLVTRGLRIVGAHDSHPPASATDRDFWTSWAMEELFLAYLARQQIQTADLITHRFRPQVAADAYRLVVTNKQSAMGVLLQWGDAPAAEPAGGSQAAEIQDLVPASTS